MTALRECPFCGSERVRLRGDHGYFAVSCTECHALSTWVDDEDLAVRAWNRRADDLISITPKGLAMLGEDAE